MLGENGLRDVIQYSSWATVSLTQFCQSLTPAQLELKAEGTYGSIGATLSHLLRAEGVYLARLTDRAPSPRRWTEVDIKDLLSAGRELAAAWEQVPLEALDWQGEVDTIRGKQRKSIVLVQALGHAAEHRGQVCTILGANSIVPPPIDAFAFSGQQRTADRQT